MGSVADFTVFAIVGRFVDRVDVGSGFVWISECEEFVEYVLFEFIVVWRLFAIETGFNLSFDIVVGFANAVQDKCGDDDVKSFF